MAGPGSAPFGPVVAALRSFLRVTRTAPHGCGPLRPHLALLLPELGEARPSEDRATLLEAIRCGLRTMVAARPAVMLLDDVHACDEATLELLAVLAPSLEDLQLLIVAAYRSDELLRSHPLRGCATTCVATGRSWRSRSSRSTPGESAQLVGQVLGVRPSPRLAKALHEDGGVPSARRRACSAWARRGDGRTPSTCATSWALSRRPAARPQSPRAPGRDAGRGAAGAAGVTAGARRSGSRDDQQVQVLEAGASTARSSSVASSQACTSSSSMTAGRRATIVRRPQRIASSSVAGRRSAEPRRARGAAGRGAGAAARSRRGRRVAAQEAAQRGDDRAERRAPGPGHAPDEQRPGGAVDDLLHEAGLADARLAREEDQRAVAVLRGGERGIEPRSLVITSDEGAGLHDAIVREPGEEFRREGPAGRCCRTRRTPRDDVGREAAAAGVLEHDVALSASWTQRSCRLPRSCGARCRTSRPSTIRGLLRDAAQLVVGQTAGSGDLTFDQVGGHGSQATPDAQRCHPQDCRTSRRGVAVFAVWFGP